MKNPKSFIVDYQLLSEYSSLNEICLLSEDIFTFILLENTRVASIITNYIFLNFTLQNINDFKMPFITPFL